MGVFDLGNDLSNEDIETDPFAITGQSAGTDEVFNDKWGIGKITTIFEDHFKALDTTYIWTRTLTGTGATAIVTGALSMTALGGAGTAKVIADGVSAPKNFSVNLSNARYQEVLFETNFRDATGDGIIEAGLFTDVNNYIIITGSTGGGWTFKTNKAGTSTSKTVNVLTNSERYTNMKIIASKGSALLFIDGGFQGRINSNIPTGDLFCYFNLDSSNEELHIRFVKLLASINK